MKIFPASIRPRRSFFLFSVLTFAILSLCVSANSQTNADTKIKALDRVSAQKFTEALPLLEKLSQATPGDAEVQYYLGFCLLGQSKNTTDKDTAKALRVRARSAFVKARDLGMNTPSVQGLIDGIPADGGAEPGYSSNPKADEYMNKGEAAFSSGKLDEALANYQNALKLDPKTYFAALFSGDVYVQKGQYADAETWYQKAIAIDPFTETAYRYSATPLMKQGKTDEARDRYIEAFILAPYNRLAVGGLVQWGQATQTRLAHPKIDLPEFTIGSDGKVKSTLNVNPTADDGSIAWIGYTAIRTEWYEKKFKTTYPTEPTYRHTLREEAEALRSVIAVVKETSGKTKALNPQLATLVKLDQDGFLESFILLAIPDQGIAQDHAGYVKQNREKLRQYVAKYVISSK